MIRRPPRSTPKPSSAASDVYKRQAQEGLPFLLPHITKQRVHLPLPLFMSLVTERVLRIPRTVPYTTVRPPKVAPEAAAAAETPEKTLEEVKAAAEARPAGGFAATTSRMPPPEIECPEVAKELEAVCAGCCVALLRYARHRHAVA